MNFPVFYLVLSLLYILFIQIMFSVYFKNHFFSQTHQVVLQITCFLKLSIHHGIYMMVYHSYSSLESNVLSLWSFIIEISIHYKPQFAVPINSRLLMDEDDLKCVTN